MDSRRAKTIALRLLEGDVRQPLGGERGHHRSLAGPGSGAGRREVAASFPTCREKDRQVGKLAATKGGDASPSQSSTWKRSRTRGESFLFSSGFFRAKARTFFCLLRLHNT